MSYHWTRREVLKAGAAAMVLASVPGQALGMEDAAEVGWRVGLAKVRITPKGPIPMAGTGGFHPLVSNGVLDELYAKAMAIEDAEGQQALLVTADLLFFRAPMAEAVCQRIMAKTGLTRRQILLNASHAHSGPVFGLKDPDRFPMSEDQRKTVDAYTERLQTQLAELASQALADMKPARLSWGAGTAKFVMNRRLMTPEGKCCGMDANPQGPVDHTVPVLRVDSPEGRLRALVFSCACHPVTLIGNGKISGDYVSFAQRYIEDQHPGAQAMFVSGCGGDANPHPYGGPQREQLVRKHGKDLGSEVCRVAAGSMEPVRGPLQVRLKWTDLPLEHTLTREQLQEIIDNRRHGCRDRFTRSTESYWHMRNARGMLEVLERNEPLPKHYRAPIALWQFGEDLTLVGLPGEAVADYVPMLQKALGPGRLWITAYCNESFGYLPTAKILEEGGHESMCLTLEIGFFSPDVQDVVIATVQQLATGLKKPSHRNPEENGSYE